MVGRALIRLRFAYSITGASDPEDFPRWHVSVASTSPPSQLASPRGPLNI